jgi:H+/Cl- antiporter ClcA
VAVFASVSNTPLACAIMGVELFGSDMAVPLAVGCVVAYMFSSHRGILSTQRISVAKFGPAINGRPTLSTWRERHERPAD